MFWFLLLSESSYISDRTKRNDPFNNYIIFKRRDRQAAIDLKAMSTCVGKWRRDSETLWRAGKPFPFPESPLTSPPPPPSRNLPTPPPPSDSDDGESWPGASVSISLTHSGLRSTWKSAEILQLFETSKSARLMKNGSTWSSGRGKSDARAMIKYRKQILDEQPRCGHIFENKWMISCSRRARPIKTTVRRLTSTRWSNSMFYYIQ